VSAETSATPVTQGQALEERFFLGLRLNRGVNLDHIRQEFGDEVDRFMPVIDELTADGLLDRRESRVRLTPRGRLVSNDVFETFIETSTVLE
jgi:oxygen-independent coproporphyrinogen-3 oxidase